MEPCLDCAAHRIDAPGEGGRCRGFPRIPRRHMRREVAWERDMTRDQSRGGVDAEPTGQAGGAVSERLAEPGAGMDLQAYRSPKVCRLTAMVSHAYAVGGDPAPARRVAPKRLQRKGAVRHGLGKKIRPCALVAVLTPGNVVSQI